MFIFEVRTGLLHVISKSFYFEGLSNKQSKSVNELDRAFWLLSLGFGNSADRV
jgi:hypothetical protein